VVVDEKMGEIMMKWIGGNDGEEKSWGWCCGGGCGCW
jgi:hypothetical protein